MRKNNKSGLIIGILFGIIVMLVIIIGLFATNIIGFSSKTDNVSDKKANNEEKLDEQKEDFQENNNIEEDEYLAIIEEYKGALNDKDFNYHAYDNSVIFKYVFFDINNDGKNEMIVGDGNNAIYEIYTYDGKKVLRFYDDGCLGERCSSSIYDNGIIYFYGSGGASVHGLDFYKVAGDGYSKEVIKSYSVEYDSNGNVTIMDNNTKSVTNFKKDEEVISSVIGSAKKVDLSKLDWIEIK